jgi:hypothetical protein
MNSSLGSIGIDKYMRNNMFALELEPIHWKTPESNKRNIYFSYIFLFLILIALNWNNLFVNWGLSDPLQFPYVTKISFLLFFLCYFFYRGIILPFKKGASYSDLLPFNFIFIIIFSFFIDVTKIFAFAFSKFKKGIKLYND